MEQHQGGAEDVSSEPIASIAGGNRNSRQPSPQNHRLLFLYEAVFVGSFNMFNSWLVAWLFFHRRAIIPIWGASGVVFNSFPSSFAPAFLITLAGTFALRRRFAAAARHDPVLPSQWPLIAKLPANLWQRALVIGIVSGIITVSVTILWAVIARPGALDFRGFMNTQMVQAGILGVIVGPIVGARVLLEPKRGG